MGRTEIKSPDANVQAAVEYTGLPEDVVLWLNKKNQEDKNCDYLYKVEVVNSLFQNEDFQKVLASIIALQLN